MTADDLKVLLEAEFSDAGITVTGTGANYDIKIVSDVFESKRAVQRQQMVYAVMNDLISSGEVHAVTMNLLTRSEAA